MSSLSDRMLAGGLIPHLESIHGEPVEILSGEDSGKTFIGVREIVSDQILATELSEDPRSKVIVRFKVADAPTITSQTRLKTSDGRQWTAVREPQDNYLTVDYELIAVEAIDS